MAVFTTLFTTAGNYTYDSNKIFVSGGVAGLNENLINVYARWHLNEVSGTNAPDDSGNLRDGTTINFPLWVAGKLNNCLSFDGSTQYVDCGDIANFDRTDSFSTDAWIRTSFVQNAIVGRALRSGTFRGWLLWIDPSGYLEGYLFRNVPGGDWIQVRGSTAGLNDAVWHHVAMTYDGSSTAAGIKLYVDGVEEVTTSLAQPTLSSSILNAANFNIGGVGDGVDSGILWNGRLDEVSLYNKVLSPQEVEYKYNFNNGREDFIRYTDSPSIYKTVGDSGTIASFNNFVVADGVTEGSKGYQLSSDGVTWYYWDGGAWSVSGALDYNTEAVVNTNISTFPSGPNTLYVKTFLISDGFQAEEIDEIQVTYSENLSPSVDAGVNKEVFDNLYISPFSDASFSDLDGCYSDDTEILTENGWRLLKNIVENKEKVRIATLNPKSHSLEYNYPDNYFEYDYKGKMLHIKGESIDCLVTPNHNVYLRKQLKRGWQFVKAKEINFGEIEYKKDCNWEGLNQEEFVLPSVDYTVLNKYSSVKKVKQSRKIKMEDWLRFLGIWLAEGSVYYNERPRSKSNRILKSGKKASLIKEYVISIAQNNDEKRKIIKDWVKRIGFDCGVNGNAHSKNIVFCNKQLAKYLMPLKGAKNKYIPKEFKKLSKCQLQILFDAMMLGDGHIGRYSYYSTSSKQLAHDFEEIALKLGHATNVSVSKGNYRISFNKSRLTPEIRKKSKWINYSNKVYCLEVPNHLMYVRRNGKAIWSGNSVDHAYYRVDSEVPSWTEILQGGFASLIEAVQAFSYQFVNSGTVTVRLQVEDNLGETNEDSLIVTVKQYAKTVNVKDIVTDEHILNFDFNPGDGSGTAQRDSPFTWSWDYGNFNVTVEKIFFYLKRQAIMVMDENELNIYLQASAFLNECRASIGLMTEEDQLSITAWLQQGGELITNPTSCSVVLYDENDNIKFTDTTTSHDHGHFQFNKAPSALANEGVYHLEVTIIAGGVSFTSVIPAGLLERKLIAFEGVVHLDVDNGTAGTVFPQGTPQYPVNNWADAKVISDTINLKTILVNGTLIMAADEDVSNFVIRGHSPHGARIELNGGGNENASFEDIEITGVMDGFCHMHHVHLEDITGVRGHVHNALVRGTLVLGGGQETVISDSMSGIPGLGTPIIDMGGSGQKLQLRAYAGGITVRNKTGTESVSLDFVSGQAIIEDTCTAGTIVVRGNCDRFIDNSGPGCTVTRPLLHDLKDEALGKWVLDPDAKTLTLYRLDGSVLKIMDLDDTTRTLPSFIGRTPQ